MMIIWWFKYVIQEINNDEYNDNDRNNDRY